MGDGSRFGAERARFDSHRSPIWSGAVPDLAPNSIFHSLISSLTRGSTEPCSGDSFSFSGDIRTLAAFSGNNLPLQRCVMAILRPRMPGVSKLRPRTPSASKSCPAMPSVSECRPATPGLSRSRPRAPGVSRSRPERMDVRGKRVHWDTTCASRHMQIAEATGQ